MPTGCQTMKDMHHCIIFSSQSSPTCPPANVDLSVYLCKPSQRENFLAHLEFSNCCFFKLKGNHSTIRISILLGFVVVLCLIIAPRILSRPVHIDLSNSPVLSHSIYVLQLINIDIICVFFVSMNSTATNILVHIFSWFFIYVWDKFLKLSCSFPI